MNRVVEGYGQALFDLNIPAAVMGDCKELLEKNPELMDALANPAVTADEKHRVIDRLFPCQVRAFLKVLCDNGHMGDIRQVERVYERCRMEGENTMEAELSYAHGLDPELVEKLKETIAKKYKKAGVKLIVRHDPSLMSGFILRIDDQEYDRSAKGRLTKIHRKLAWR